MKRSLLSLILPVLLLPLSSTVTAAEQVQPIEWLLQQVRIGEATNKYDLVSASLYRLEKIAPEDPQVLAAQIRLALRQGQQEKARQLMVTLKAVSPDSLVTRQTEASLLLLSDAGRQQLQQARLLATAGRLAEARALYDRQFNGIFPSSEIALEYWRLVARLPGEETRALAELSALDQQAPGNINVRMAIAQMELSRNNPAAAVKQLQAVAADPAGEMQAAQLWLSSIKSQPVTAQSVAQLKVYLDTFTHDKPQSDGVAELTRQQKMLADPAYQQRLRGLAMIEQGEGTAAIPALRAALKAAPDDPDLLGAMGQALARADNREAANDYLQRAIAADAQGTDIGKWRSLLQSNQYWLAIAQGDKALTAGDLSQASRQYQLAHSLDNQDGYALIGQGDVAQARKDPATAEELYRQALRSDPGNATAVQRLAALYQQQSPQKALAFINGLSAAQKSSVSATLASLRSNALSGEGDQLAEAGNWPQAAEKYRLAQQAAPQDIWLNYRLAGALRRAGQPQAADERMQAMARQQPDEPAQVYANALYLSGSDRADAALAQLHALPKAKWDRNMQDLADRLENDRKQAQAEARLDEVEALVARNQLNTAHTKLGALPADFSLQSVNSGRRVANAWLAAGEPQQAATIYQQLKPLAAREGPSQSSSLLYRDAARLETLQQQPQAARADYARAMVASGITPVQPDSNEEYTRLTRNDGRDDWLKRGIRSDAADLYRQQETTLTLEEDYSRNKGTGGISDFTAHTTMIEAEAPFSVGKGFFRLDNVDLSAGSFLRSSTGTIDENFGTCASADAVCNRDFRQHQNGTSVGLGYRSDRWSADLGSTPLGFAVTNWVGGLTWNTDLQDLGVSLTASRRPISSSLLSYAGARDPNPASGKTWGGVVATGGALGLSYDQGKANGIWASLSAHQITGENVADNSRERIMAGYYYKLINEDNRRATIGLNGMVWHYAHDLSDYSLGQGGYYSPQRYNSIAVPVTWRQRTENWSYDLAGSVSWSHSETRAESRYPLDFGSLTRDNPKSSDSSSSGFGYTLRALVERRLTSHWTLGMGIDIQQAKDYTPSHGLIYARYSMAGWEGDLNMPPEPLTPYADFD
ncbi:cellulose biosynthesis protein BcsC [Erwinia pyri]|uniref:Cellulose biosynthesis protein BcsC n=1 Tax=Erwinia pyri TaxID=3062598 RepID=A0AA50DL99_9GAMM|nr:cellulose biosynthesis protein BcsC [Erwinia sp. DE2]WLS79082.1 cellulose biosynthesis protein BcsC [Erwinia sp. DE2]